MQLLQQPHMAACCQVVVAMLDFPMPCIALIGADTYTAYSASGAQTLLVARHSARYAESLLSCGRCRVSSKTLNIKLPWSIVGRCLRVGALAIAATGCANLRGQFA